MESIPRLEGEHAHLVTDLPTQEKLLDEYKEKAKGTQQRSLAFAGSFQNSIASWVSKMVTNDM